MNKLTAQTKTMFCVLALTAGLFTGSSTADARSIGAFAGRPLDGSPWNCFAESAGAVKGTGAADCVKPDDSSSPRWEVGLPIESAGYWTVTVGIRGNGNDGPSCYAYVVDQLTGTIIGSDPMKNVSTSFVLQSVRVPMFFNGGYLFVACGHLVDDNFRVGSINWNQS